MLTIEEFKLIVQNTESTVLDFKRELYDFSRADNLAKFVKDVISFANTIRNEKAYIIFGVIENQEGDNELIGIEKDIDDAILQDKLKNKVIPRPLFAYYSISYDQKKFGVIEIPLNNYEYPIIAAEKLKGIEVGKTYYRNGTSNTEATSLDVIRIYNWFKTLGNRVNEESLIDKISLLLKRTISEEEKLSAVVLDILEIAKKHNLYDLEKFCLFQFKGVPDSELDKHRYRIIKVIISLNTVDINPYSYVKATSNLMKSEMLKMEGFFERGILFNQSILAIEENLENFKSNPNLTYGTMKLSSKRFSKSVKEYTLYCYFFNDNITGMYNKIRQKIIDELMKVQ